LEEKDVAIEKSKSNRSIKAKKILWLIFHWLIIISFVTQIVYGAVQTFFILVPEDGLPGPLLGRSIDIPHELLVARRLYAIETWIAITGLVIYLAISYKPQLHQALKRAEKKKSLE
jgi:hypothetical protein